MKNHIFTNLWSVCLLTLLCCFLWGSAFPCIKVGYSFFSVDDGDYLSQILFAGVRFSLAGILVILFGSISGTLSGKAEKGLLKPARSSWKMIIILSFLQTMIQYTFFYIGMAHTPGVKASILTGTNVFLSVLVAALVFKFEKLTPQKILGIFVGFTGIVIINLTGLGNTGADFHLTGEGFILLSAISHAFSSAAMKRFSLKENPVTLSGYQFLLGGLVMTIVSFLLGGRIHPSGLECFILLLYMALISAVAYTIWSILLKYNPVSRIAVFRFANPLFGALLSALILGNSSQISFLQTITALAFVCGGIIIVNTCPTQKISEKHPDDTLAGHDPIN